MTNFIIFLILIRPFVEFFHGYDLFSFGSYGINPLSIWSGLMIFASIFYWILKKRDPFQFQITKYIIVFIFSLSFSVVFSNNLGSIIQQLLKVVSWLIVIPIFIDFATKHNIYIFINKIYRVTFLFLIINTILYFMGIFNTGKYGLGEFYSLYSGPHSFAFTLLYLTPFILTKINNDKKKLMPKIALGLLIVFILGTFVRSAWLALLVGMVVYISLDKRYRTKLVIQFTFIFIILIILIFFEHGFVNDIFFKRNVDFEEAIASGELGTIGSGRFYFWSRQLHYFFDSSIKNILFGAGLGTIMDITLKQAGVHIGGHNDYIDLLISSGIISVFAFILFQIKLLRLLINNNIKKNTAISRTALSLLFMVLVVGIVNGNLYWQSNVYVACFWGMAIGKKAQIN